MPTSLPYPSLHATHGGIWTAGPNGEVRAIGRGEAISLAAESPMIMINTPLVGQRIGYPDISGLDVLARFAVPTPKGLADALGLPAPATDSECASFLRDAAARLLDTLAGDWPCRQGAWASAQALHRLRWAWAGAVAARLTRPARDEPWLFSRLPEWEESPPRPQPKPVRIPGDEAVRRLAELTGHAAEAREGCERLRAPAG
jgi:ATP-dependent DNA helicase DinG